MSILKGNIGIMSDSQLPFEDPDSLKFYRKIAKKYNIKHWFHVGDLVDGYNWSRYDKHPSAPNPDEEVEMVRKRFKQWGKYFPNVNCIIGNHDARLMKSLVTAGLSEKIMPFSRCMKTIFNAPDGWTFHESLIIKTKGGPFRLLHGDETGCSSIPYRTITKTLMSAIKGHFHSSSYVCHRNVNGKLIYDVQVGCTMGDNTVASKYNKRDTLRPLKNCAVILDGVPHIIPMGSVL